MTYGSTNNALFFQPYEDDWRKCVNVYLTSTNNIHLLDISFVKRYMRSVFKKQRKRDLCNQAVKTKCYKDKTHHKNKFKIL